ncbi:MAG: TIGR00159 family protein, partial [Flavobacteriales bacterium]|nr:TIGR00159 family protein [Flavobacteriales bacterium]
MLLFIDIKFKDVLDVLLVAFILYQLFQLTRGTAAIKIFLGLAFIYVLWKIV